MEPAAAGESLLGLEMVQSLHILVKHKESRNPSSWRSAFIGRSKRDAITILRYYRREINEATKSEEKFRELAKKFSDCDSAEREGYLGPVGRRPQEQPFSDALSALEVGQMSDVVDTSSGLHLIYRLN